MGVAGYDIYRNGSLAKTVTGATTSWTDTGLQPSTAYTYTVDAFDAVPNTSAQSTAATATTQGGTGSAGPCGGLQRPSGGPTYTHIVVIMDENTSYSAWHGAANAPYTNQVAAQCALASSFRGVTHPSQPNYVAAATGIQPTFNVKVADDNVYHQLGAAGKSWAVLEESMPSNCKSGSSGLYKAGHNPAIYLTNLGSAGDGSCSKNNTGFTLSNFTTSMLANYTFIAPNICNDMHWASACTGSSSSAVPNGDTWLSQLLPKIFASADYQAGNTLVLVTFDEGVEAAAPQGITCITQPNPDTVGCHIPTIAMSEYITPGTVDPSSYSLYSILASVEKNFGLPLLGNAQTQNPLGPGMGL